MKKQYSKPELNIIEFDHADIIATSGTLQLNNDPYDDNIYGD